VVAEVANCIRALFYKPLAGPGTDGKFSWYMTNRRGDIVVLTDELLTSCPLQSDPGAPPEFYIHTKRKPVTLCRVRNAGSRHAW